MPSRSSGTRCRRPGRVLVIDDEPAVLRQIAEMLSDAHEVVAVISAAQALERLLAGERYDVVLCDLMMPIMDGIELHRRLAASLPDEADRIVFFTGDALTARVDAFFAHVPNVLLEKPIDFEGLRGLVERRARGDNAPRAAER
jgi:CheY-like chemotaxis protein